MQKSTTLQVCATSTRHSSKIQDSYSARIFHSAAKTENRKCGSSMPHGSLQHRFGMKQLRKIGLKNNGWSMTNGFECSWNQSVEPIEHAPATMTPRRSSCDHNST